MENLTEEQREKIRKMSDERLQQKLISAGMPAAAVNALDGSVLLETRAELLASGREKPIQAATVVPMADPEIEKKDALNSRNVNGQMNCIYNSSSLV